MDRYGKGYEWVPCRSPRPLTGGFVLSSAKDHFFFGAAFLAAFFGAAFLAAFLAAFFGAAFLAQAFFAAATRARRLEGRLLPALPIVRFPFFVFLSPFPIGWLVRDLAKCIRRSKEGTPSVLHTSQPARVDRDGMPRVDH